MNVISFIEEHLNEEIPTEEICKACNSSKSSIEKIFRFIALFSVQDYVLRRKMMKSAKLLIEKPELNILDVAVEYGYSSHESFTRAFFSVWNENPSDFRNQHKNSRRFAELFPRLTNFYQIEGEPFMRRTVDVSELYDFFKERKDCYFVCGDIKHLVELNSIDFKVGDLAILESMKRMESVCGEDDFLFRFGPDEFAIITNSTDEKYANSLKEKILALNGGTVCFNGKDIPVNLYISISQYKKSNVDYKTLFETLHDSIVK